jgi:DMSO/TMAO reductase YedYZ molybdopterin-dependent catalytic subunit
MRRAAASAAVALILLGRAAAADTGSVTPGGAGLTLDGLVDHPLHLSEADLAALPATELDASFQTHRGPEAAHYKGVLLWTLVGKAGISAKDGDRRDRLHHYLLVTGRDGYAVAVAVGELDPDFEGKKAIVAYEADGKPLAADEVRLVVPGDKHGGRAVRDVVHIEVK